MKLLMDKSNLKDQVRYSLKLTELREKRGVETRKVMREQAGLIEAKRLQDTKVRVQKQIDELKRKVQNKTFKKSSKTAY
jgi:hypothetical protein